MKINKYILGLAVAVLGGFTSCNTDVEGDYYSTGFENVSFEVKSASVSVVVDESTATIPVKLTRSNVKSAYTAHYTAAASAEGIFSDDGNGTVTFAEGQGTATINVKAANLEKEVPYTYTLTLSDVDVASADTITNTQIKTMTINVQREGDWTEWKKWNSAGTADYNYGGYFFSGEDPDLSFLYRQNVASPSKYQFKLLHWGYDVELVMNYDKETGVVYVPETFTGYTHSTYGDIFIGDYTDYNPASPVHGTFDEAKGIISLVVYYYDAEGPWGAGYEYIYLDGYVRADYTIEDFTFAGIFTDPSQNVFAVGNLTLAADANNVKAVVIEEDADLDAVADAIAAGELEATDVEGGQIYVPIPDDMEGKLQIIVVSLDADGAVADAKSAKFEYFGGGANPWKSLGIGYLTDNFVISRFYKDQSTGEVWTPQTYEVEILENNETPGVYRIVNPYRNAVVLLVGESAADNYYTSANLEINASDADGVYFLPTEVGFNNMQVTSYGGFWLARGGEGNDFASLKADGLLGRLRNGVISLPGFYYEDENGNQTGDIFQGFVYSNDAWRYGGWVDNETPFAVVLPSAAAAVKKNAALKARASQFERNLCGLNLMDDSRILKQKVRKIDGQIGGKNITTRIQKSLKLHKVLKH